jgi:hypothetical protein
MLCVGAGPVDGPSHLTTAEMLAPPATFFGGAAVNYEIADQQV